MNYSRAGGILLHPTSLPGRFGIGDLGPEAYRWVDFLANTGCGLWQVLPLGPTGYGDSPYQCFSAFAGNPYLISPDLLLETGLLTADDLVESQLFPADQVEYGRVIPWKLQLLDKCFDTFQQGVFPDLESELNSFREAQAGWLGEFGLFMALKEFHGGGTWLEWPAPLRLRDPNTLAAARQAHSRAIERQEFRQYLFYRQWSDLRGYARTQGIRVIGDLPIFVAADSSEVWSHPELFYLDGRRQPTVVAGVPPDYFSPTGQLWGNPLYNWETHAKDEYTWWIARLRSVLSMVDVIRLDHFRGFAGYWEIPAGETTAERGRWRPGPGIDFFHVVGEELGDMPIIAEDLGEITPDVIELRDRLGLPGMKILVFAFNAGAANPFLPHRIPKNSVVYTGTHDNDTAVGWYNRVEDDERDFFRRYLGVSGDGIGWTLIRAAWRSRAVMALAPLQDFLELGNEARMNYPGRPSGNWTWRMPAGALSPELAAKIRELNGLYGRTEI
jgi:4-alpha-glucanotransferase